MQLTRRSFFHATWAIPSLFGLAQITTSTRLDATLAAHAQWLQDPRQGRRAELVGADLRGLVLQDCSLANANLDRADLSGSILNGVDLSRASLVGARLERARLIECRIDGVNFTAAKMRDSVLDCFFSDEEGDHASMADGVSFFHADLHRARVAINVAEADFRQADLRNADFSMSMFDARSRGRISFAQSDLRNASFDQATLTLVDFSESIMSGGVLSGADVGECNFHHVRRTS